MLFAIEFGFTYFAIMAVLLLGAIGLFIFVRKKQQ